MLLLFSEAMIQKQCMTFTARIEGVRTPIISLPLLSFPNASVRDADPRKRVEMFFRRQREVSTLQEKLGVDAGGSTLDELVTLFPLSGGTDFGMKILGTTTCR
jgi:hypothetical protein